MLHSLTTHKPDRPPCPCRFSRFPQEIVLRLEEPSKVHQIQILSHEYKVKFRRHFATAAGTQLDDTAGLGGNKYSANLAQPWRTQPLADCHGGAGAAPRSFTAAYRWP